MKGQNKTFEFADQPSPEIPPLIHATITIDGSHPASSNPEIESILKRILMLTCSVLTTYPAKEYEILKRLTDSYRERILDIFKERASDDEAQVNFMDPNQLEIFEGLDRSKPVVLD